MNSTTLLMSAFLVLGTVLGACFTYIWLRKSAHRTHDRLDRALVELETRTSAETAARVRVATLATQNEHLQTLLEDELRYRLDLAWALGRLSVPPCESADASGATGGDRTGVPDGALFDRRRREGADSVQRGASGDLRLVRDEPVATRRTQGLSRTAPGPVSLPPSA